jgi:hypothetical protein
MARPYLKHSLVELEDLVRKNKHSLAVLGEIRTELTYRTTDGAKALLRDVLGLLTGQVAMPRRPPPPDGPESQLPLLGGDKADNKGSPQ